MLAKEVAMREVFADFLTILFVVVLLLTIVKNLVDKRRL